MYDHNILLSDAELLAKVRRISILFPDGRPRQRSKPCKSQKASVWRRAGGLCESCRGAGPGLHVHHIVPRSKGGKNRASNLRLSCRVCDRSDHRRYGLA